jgi:glycosyltransferase involved in cell wall biosynthesis
MKHLVVFSHKLFRRTARGFETTGGFTFQVDALAPYFGRVTVSVPVVDDPGFAGVLLMASNVSVSPLPAYARKAEFISKLPRTVSRIRAAMGPGDLVLCFIPGYVGVLASWIAQRDGASLFQFVVTDWGHRFRVRDDSWSRRILAVAVSPLLDGLMSRLTRDVLAFFNGDVLYGGRPGLHFPRVSSSLAQNSFYECEKPRLSPPYRLLFVGRLAGEKGVAYLLKAVDLLRAQGVPVSLDIVGEGSERQTLERLGSAPGLQGAIRFHGYVPRGPQLDAFYRAADIFVLPSLEDRQPKVLLEAMASSLPVVASRVGGIPTHVRDGETGLLFTPRDEGELADAIRKLIECPGLRQRLIRKGMKYARAHTLEAETERTMRIVFDHFAAGELQKRAVASESGQ